MRYASLRCTSNTEVNMYHWPLCIISWIILTLPLHVFFLFICCQFVHTAVNSEYSILLKVVVSLHITILLIILRRTAHSTFPSFIVHMHCSLLWISVLLCNYVMLSVCVYVYPFYASLLLPSSQIICHFDFSRFIDMSRYVIIYCMWISKSQMTCNLEFRGAVA